MGMRLQKFARWWSDSRKTDTAYFKFFATCCRQPAHDKPAVRGPEGKSKGKRKEKSQKLDEGVPRASDWRSRLELIESASPVALAEHPRLVECMPNSTSTGIVLHSSIGDTTPLFTDY
jgi:hypothetical protein